ncbi:hypothetical protein V5799_032398 [Amblyomma americanum]|uniref:Uncharacterized protein n=1 Tax=Amblyomma americanum TaxID=6943 RepID=A0AAQ4DRA0_AMBAM
MCSDRFRTTVNIFSDSVGSAIVQQFSSLKPLEDSQDESDDEPAPAQKLKNESKTSAPAQTEDEPMFESTEEEYQPLRTLKPQPKPVQRADGHRSQSPTGWKHQRHMSLPKDAVSVASTSSVGSYPL